MLVAITNEVTCHRIEEGMFFLRPSHDKVIER